MMILTLILLPLVGLLITCIKNNYVYDIDSNQNSIEENYRTTVSIKSTALKTSILTLFISFLIYILFNFSTNQFQFVEEYYEISDFSLYLGIDDSSIYFVLFITIMIPISLVSNWKPISKIKWCMAIMLLESILLLVFLSLDIFSSYIFFERIFALFFPVITLLSSSGFSLRFFLSQVLWLAIVYCFRASLKHFLSVFAKVMLNIILYFDKYVIYVVIWVVYIVCVNYFTQPILCEDEISFTKSMENGSIHRTRLPLANGQKIKDLAPGLYEVTGGCIEVGNYSGGNTVRLCSLTPDSWQQIGNSSAYSVNNRPFNTNFAKVLYEVRAVGQTSVSRGSLDGGHIIKNSGGLFYDYLISCKTTLGQISTHDESGAIRLNNKFLNSLAK